MADFGEAYDYVVVGGGSAGCALAGRLSEESGFRVALIEAGKDYPPGEEPWQITDSFAGVAFNDPQFIWNRLQVFVPPRPGNAPDGRQTRLYQQGRVIGGGSSVNGMMANRGLPADYAEWEERGATGWGWDDVLPYFKKLETDTDFDGPMHGDGGPIGVRRIFPDAWPGYTRAVMNAARDAGYAYIEDQNSDFSDGYFPIAISNLENRRISSAIAYLNSDARKRPNLHIVDEAHVERLETDGAKVTGVRIRRHGKMKSIAAREVIVSSGALHSPALLMRSGIGPGARLADMGIEVVADRPGVGQNLMEHPGISFGTYMKPESRLAPDMRRQLIAAMRYSSGLEGCPDSDMFLIPSNKVAWHALGDRIGATLVWINKSYSTGEVTLASPDPYEEPKVDFNMCSDRRDLDRLVKGVRFLAVLHASPVLRAAVHEIFPATYSDSVRRSMAPSWSNGVKTRIASALMDGSSTLRKLFVNKVINEGPSLEELLVDDETIESWVRQTVTGHWHASCTCRMGAPDDPYAVTDPDGRVYGVDGLRVCDTSIMPAVPRANTNIPTIMMAEKIADAIRRPAKA